MNLKDKTILITGGAGFIGSNLADKLLLQNKIIVVDNFDNFYDAKIKEDNVSCNFGNGNYKLYRVDITNKEFFEKVFVENQIDVVIHLAAKVGVRNSINDPESYVKTNILGTLNVLELMKKYRINKLIFASSSSVYGNCREKVFSEKLNLSEPISPYAVTKISCENLCYTYHKLYGMKIICLRFFTAYGPRQRPDLAIHKFAKLITEGQPIPIFGDGSTTRDYTFVDDITDGIISAINYDKTGYEIINLGGSESVSLCSLVKILEKVLNKKALIDTQPMQQGDVDRTASDITKAKQLLGYNPKIRLAEGIKKFVDWQKNNSKSEG